MSTSYPLPQSKSHYEILDGLRGVAALMVVAFHLCEAHAGGSVFHQTINHGYMAVDFFFLLSGFVIAYAYDDRWTRMTQVEFYKRRLVRLQPMVIMGNVIGAALFYLQRSGEFPLIAGTPVWKMLLVMLVGFTLIPLLPSMDIRGWSEMHPLDGPAWSLFYEYLANIAYALGLRRLPKRWLGVLVALAALFLLQLLVFGPRGDVIGGWAVDRTELHVGFARLLYPFFAGILLERVGKLIHIRHAFAIASAVLIVTFSLPRFGGPQHLWVNGLYEGFCIIVVFPIVVALGAGDRLSRPGPIRLCRFLGELSYPLYITHYPLIYLYTAWAVEKHKTLAQGAPVAVLTLLAAVAIAYASLKFYDEPVRRWLSARYLRRAA